MRSEQITSFASWFALFRFYSFSCSSYLQLRVCLCSRYKYAIAKAEQTKQISKIF